MRFVETIKIVDGVVQNYDYHRNRAMRTTGIRLPEIHVPQEFVNGLVKCRVLYTCCMQKVEFSPYRLPSIKSLKVIEIPQNLYPLKYEGRSFINEALLLREDCDDILFTIDNKICDTSFCNIVFENENGYFTPETFLLAGTKRKRLIDEGVIKAIPINIEEIGQYKRAHLINAMIELGEVVLDIEMIQR